MDRTNDTPLIAVDDLSVDFRSGERRHPCRRHVSFDIGKAETVALVGESGSGKTVTALSILKLLPYPSASHPSGKILFNGDEPAVAAAGGACARSGATRSP